MIRLLIFIILSSFLCAFSGCGQNQRPAKQPEVDMAEYNRVAAKKEGLQIEKYVKAQGWPTTKTGTGVHYYIYEHGNGDSAKVGSLAEVKMTITLLNGDTCYHWEKYGTEKFLIEQDAMESGLHEAIQYLQVGDKAKIVLPSFRAFGVAGDRNKIPPRHSVVYDLELVGIR